MKLQQPFYNKKVIVFDLDGTIIKLNVNWDELKKTLSERYYEIYNEKHYKFESVSACLSFIVEKGDEQELNNFFDIIRKFEVAGVSSSTPIEETIYFIKNKSEFNINNTVKFSVLSLNTRACINEALKKAGIQKEIDYIVGREDVRHWKPNPEGLLKIKDHYGINKKEMIYIGDLQKDIETGKNAGIDAILIDDIKKLVRMKRGIIGG
ncbi:MAG: HAD family hydrolase [Promethearchaeota archaeon]